VLKPTTTHTKPFSLFLNLAVDEAATAAGQAPFWIAGYFVA
jgi:hypothetical protein